MSAWKRLLWKMLMTRSMEFRSCRSSAWLSLERYSCRRRRARCVSASGDQTHGDRRTGQRDRGRNKRPGPPQPHRFFVRSQGEGGQDGTPGGLPPPGSRPSSPVPPLSCSDSGSCRVRRRAVLTLFPDGHGAPGRGRSASQTLSPARGGAAGAAARLPLPAGRGGAAAAPPD